MSVEDGPVERFEMVEVVRAIKMALAELGQRHRGDVGLDDGKAILVADVQIIPEGLGAGIDVRVRKGHAANCRSVGNEARGKSARRDSHRRRAYGTHPNSLRLTPPCK